ncbi:hypothetical protein AC1031_017397 [Aphanomyces cochlioides]|nr:hypothetical protein AC1031_017397 [Aphanomyces cochlioides]
MQDGATSSGLHLHLEMIESSSLECNLHGLMTARLHYLNRSFADTTMVKLALFAALLALTTAAPARPQLRGHDSSLSRGQYGSGARGVGAGGYGITADGPKPELPLLNHAQEAESIERRRLHDLWYYAPRADSVHPDSFIFTPVLPDDVRPDGQEIEHSIHDRRLHDLWYYAPHPLTPKQEPKRRLHDLWYYAPHADGKADSHPASPSKEAIESLNRHAPFGF